MVGKSKIDRTPVGAHYGWKDFLAQRVTAVIMAVLSGVFLASFVIKGGMGYADWKAMFGQPTFRVLALLFLLSVYYHAWIGIRDVLMDYVKPAGIRLFGQVLVILFLVVCAIWSVVILWGL